MARTWTLLMVFTLALTATVRANAQTQTFNVTNSGFTNYNFAGLGNDPELTLERGKTYTFDLNASGHPFWIKTVRGNGTGNAYNDGVSGNGTAVGAVVFTVPESAPDTLFYNCQIHSSMTGTIVIIDAAASEPAFVVSFDEPDGEVGPTDTVVVKTTIGVAQNSSPIVFGAALDGSFEAGGEMFVLSQFINRGDFFPDYDLDFAEDNFNSAFAGMTMNPGDSVSVTFATMTPPVEGASPGVYSLGTAAARVLTPTFVFVSDFSASNDFQRTVVPEPGANSLLAAAFVTLAVLRRFRSGPFLVADRYPQE